MIPDVDQNEETGEQSEDTKIVPTDEEESDKEGMERMKELAVIYKDDIRRWAWHVMVKLNRFFLTREHKSAEDRPEAFKFGVYDGLFKLQPRANSNCMTDGPTYVRTLWHLF